jgi:hypothetical protein
MGKRSNNLKYEDGEDVYENNGVLSLSKEEIIELEKIKGKKADSLEIIKWVFDNMLLEVAPKDAISVGAYCYLKRCQNDVTIQSEFYKNIWPKILPKNDVIQKYEEGLRNDANSCIHAIDRVLSICDSLHS